MCMIDDAECFSWFFEEQRKARKPYTCCECQRAISAGERYEYVGGVYDGHFDTYRTCLHCVAASSWLDEECNGHLFGGIAEELSEHWSADASYRSVWLARALIGIRRKWRRRDGQLMPVLASFVARERAA